MSRCHPPLPCCRARPRRARLVLLTFGLVACVTGAASSPLGGGRTVVLEPVPSGSAPRTLRRVVYTCVSPELVVFSDRPCGPLPQLHELRLLDPGAGRTGASATVRAPQPAASTLPARAGSDRASAAAETAVETEADQRGETCRRLETAVRALDERMRSGYSAREAGRLWSKWREAKSRLRESDC